MYQAKRKGGGSHQIIDLREALRTLDHDSLAADLRIAFAHDSLGVAFQPVVRSSDGVMTGVEALLRWSDPLRGQVSPAAVVRVAEQSTLINRIGAWVLERACRERGTWLERVPARTARPRGERVSQAAGHTRLQRGRRRGPSRDRDGPGRADPGDDRGHPDRGHRARDDGAARAPRPRHPDRAGRLRHRVLVVELPAPPPIDIVKIDQGFIADIGRAAEGREIAAAVTNLAHVLGKSVTAEGVETEEQRAAVADMGCELAQGYYFGRPMPAADIAAGLSNGSAGPPNLPILTMS